MTATILDRSTHYAEFAVTVLGSAVAGLTVEFSRAIVGRTRDYAWSAVTDAHGQADLLLFGPDPINGLYAARALAANDEVVGQWYSIPLNSYGRHQVELTLGGDQ